MLVDHHCHLDFPDFAADLDGVVARTHAAGVGMMVTISTRVRQIDKLQTIAERYPGVFLSVGTHPHNADEEQGISVDEIVKLSRHPKCVAIGEAGLDYYYKHSSPEAQAEGFRRHIAAARETGLPLEIHTRDADADTLAILEDEHRNGPFPAVLHCYTGGRTLAMRAVELGLYVSFTGVVTFKKADALRDIARDVPLDRLLVETDAPFLAPEPYRGKTNEPAYVVRTAAALAAVHGIPLEEFATATTDNFFRLYAKAPRSARFRDAALARAEPGRRMSYRFTILGCGSSGGVPRIGMNWGACDPDNPKNRRLRCSGLFERIGRNGRTAVLVDTSPDFREQILSVRLTALDGVLFTHDHADHTHGIDDLRMVAFAMKRRVDVYFDAATGKSLRDRFAYCFKTREGSAYMPILNGFDIDGVSPIEIRGAGGTITATPIPQVHGDITSLGWRVGGLAYSPDINALPEASRSLLEGLDVWIVDALRHTPHESHFSVKQALEWVDRLKPKRTILTHMTSELDYETLRRELPAGVEPAYDGMQITY